MEKLVDVMFMIIPAWDQAGLFVGGVVLFFIGFGLVCDCYLWRKNGLKIKAQIIGVRRTYMQGAYQWRRKNKQPGFMWEMYHPVYEYIDAEGKVVQVESDGGSNALGDKIPGTWADILVDAGDPWDVRERDVIWWVFGFLFAGAGVFMLGAAFAFREINIVSIIFGGGLLGLVTWKLGIIGPGSAKNRRESTKKRRRKTKPKKKAGKILTAEELSARMIVFARNARWWIGGLGLAGLLLSGAGFVKGVQLQAFLSAAHQAPGQVVRLETRVERANRRNQTIYYPVAAYDAPDGSRNEFRDRAAGSSAPVFLAGEEITVFYDPADFNRAMIDRGLWNYSETAALGGSGILLLLIALRIFSDARRLRRVAVGSSYRREEIEEAQQEPVDEDGDGQGV